jgi:O-antigen/teichoic acid export membrane protein
MIKKGLTNVSLRGLTLGSKFILLLFIARHMTTEEMGIFGLMNVTIAIALFFLGLDFYVYNTREILAHEPKRQVGMIRDQLIFHGLIYLLALPLLISIFFLKIISWEYIGWFYLLLILEHLSQESYRLLTTFSRPLMANLILFIRSGAWIYAIVGVALLGNKIGGLSVIWSGWSIGVGLSLILAVYALRKLPWTELRNQSIDWSWLRQGARVALPFFMATLALMGVQYADRYYLEFFHGEKVVGIYTFFASIGNVVPIFIFSGSTMILYPAILSAFQRGEHRKYKYLMKKLTLAITAGSIILSIILILGIYPILSLTNKAIYRDNLSVFWIVLAGAVVFSLSNIPHYALYARRSDRAIVRSTFIAFAVSLVANTLLVPKYGLHGAAFATLLAMTALLLCKVITLKIDRSSDRESVTQIAELTRVGTGE